MHIAFAASECVPFSKTGGLADVVGALPRALAALGHQVSVYLPRYRQTKLTDPQTVVRSITIPFDDKYRFCSVVTAGTSAGVRFILWSIRHTSIARRSTETQPATIRTTPNASLCFRARCLKPRRCWECRTCSTATTGSPRWCR